MALPPPDVIIAPMPLPNEYPDIGHLASWSVSSHKLGFDVNCLRDDDPDTFWQLVVTSLCALGENFVCLRSVVSELRPMLTEAMALTHIILLSNS